MKCKIKFSEKIVVRGGGDLATGIVQKFHRSGFPVVILETGAPTAIRRSAALCEAVYEGVSQVEDVTCRRVSGFSESEGELESCWNAGTVPLLVDPEGKTIREIRPAAVIDAILAKRNLGTSMDMADVTIGLGPGFCAGTDVHAVIETQRGHDLGKLILRGCARPDTGIPGEIGGRSAERVLYAPAGGVVKCWKQVGDVVERGEVVFSVEGEFEGEAVRAPFTGLLRGMLRDGTEVPKGMKTADIDPRTDADWRTISDKARCLGGAALEAYFCLMRSARD